MFWTEVIVCCDRDRDAQISLVFHPLHGVPSKGWLSYVWDRGQRDHISVGFDIKYPCATRYPMERWQFYRVPREHDSGIQQGPHNNSIQVSLDLLLHG